MRSLVPPIATRSPSAPVAADKSARLTELGFAALLTTAAAGSSATDAGAGPAGAKDENASYGKGKTRFTLSSPPGPAVLVPAQAPVCFALQSIEAAPPEERGAVPELRAVAAPGVPTPKATAAQKTPQIATGQRATTPETALVAPDPTGETPARTQETQLATTDLQSTPKSSLDIGSALDIASLIAGRVAAPASKETLSPPSKDKSHPAKEFFAGKSESRGDVALQALDRAGVVADRAAAPMVDPIPASKSDKPAFEAATGKNSSALTHDRAVAPSPTPTPAAAPIPSPALNAIVKEHVEPQGLGPHRHAPDIVGIGREIARRLDGDRSAFDIKLDPAELGSIHVKLDVGPDNAVTAQIAAERPETLSDLIRSARELERALEGAGLSLAQNGLSFDLARRDSGHGHRAAPERAAPTSGEQEPASSPIPATAARPFGLETWSRAGVDIKI